MGTLDGEEHLLTKTSVIFCPAGMLHMRVSIRRVDKLIFRFSVVTATKYERGVREVRSCSDRGL